MKVGVKALYWLLLSALPVAVAGIVWSFFGAAEAVFRNPDLTQDAFIGPQLPPEREVIRLEKELPYNSTVQDALLRFDFDRRQIQELIDDSRSVYNLNRVKAGNRLTLERYRDGRFKSLMYEIDDLKSLLVRPDESNRYRAELKVRELETVVEEIYGEINDSTWNTLVSQGETPQLVMDLYNVLRWDVDFTAVHPGDSFKMVFEKQYDGADFVKYGDILAVSFNSKGKTFYAIQFEDPKSARKRYFDLKGDSVRKALLKVPFHFNPRISSGFSHSRFHPVLKTRRPHLGIDYAAPTGTPVLASGSGRVIFAGRSGGNGKLVKIRHPSGFTTWYLHLSRIHVRGGQAVSQGEMIGRVGSTGLASGPHLDYRIQDKRGRFLNPQKNIALPSDTKVDRADWDAFVEIRDRLKKRLESIPESKPYLNRVAVAGG